MFFNSWESLFRVLIVGVSAYAALVLLLRISGKRTLSTMNAFDLVVTVAMGSTLATTLLSRDAALADGIAALALLILLQFVLTWTSVRVPRVRGLIKATPALLFYNGSFLDDALRRERVMRAEVDAAIRSSGIAALDEVGAVVLETDGSFSVMRRPERAGYSALRRVRGADVGGSRDHRPE